MRKAVGPADRTLEIRGARANNLDDIDLDLPLRSTTLIVGVSGSGKSSLLIDTLGRESARRMQRFLDLSQGLEPADDLPAFIGPIPPMLHFGQGAFRASSRTTVATCSGLLGILRRLFLSHAVPYSDRAEEDVPPPSPSSYGAWSKEHGQGTVRIWTVPLRHQRSDGSKAVERLGAIGVSELVVRSETDPPSLQESGRQLAIEDFRPLDSTHRHSIEAEIAVLDLPKDAEDLGPALDRAFAAGSVVIELDRPGDEQEELRGDFGVLLDSDRHWLHPRDPRPFAPAHRSLLSFNQPSHERSGACPTCAGLGQAPEVDLGRLFPHPERSLHEGACDLWTPKGYKYLNIQHETIEGLRGEGGFDPDLPWQKLGDGARQLLLEGGIEVTDRDRKSGRKLGKPRPFEGLAQAVLSRFARGTATSARLAPYVQEGRCPTCGGSRWSRQARALRVGGRSLPELLDLTFSELEAVTRDGSSWYQDCGPEPLSEIGHLHDAARAFLQVGLGHLSGARGMTTLSEGESRRLRLAGLLAMGGSGLALLLDEPARGLHEHDIGQLASSLRDLGKRHTLVVNDHRFGLAPAIDHVVELGPGAGRHGGRIVRAGPPEELLDSNSRFRRETLPVPDDHPSLRLSNGSLHNLHGLSCRLPLGRWVAITGVSGSGKSSFVRGLLLPALGGILGDRLALEGFPTLPGGSWDRLDGAETIQEVLAAEQRQTEPNKRSLVATFLGVAPLLREAFGDTPQARGLGLEAADFGTNAGQGRCPSCLGLGEIEEGPHTSPCPECAGRRYGEAAASVELGGFTIVDLLAETVADLDLPAETWGEELPTALTTLVELDLGHLGLGRRLDRLSGGEIQRLRIARRLWQARHHDLLLILDEPAAGLHPEDVARLARVLDRIVGDGTNTLLLIEHNPDLVRAADWIVDFGPGGGPQGGHIVGQGPPSVLRELDTPTGRVLRGLPAQSLRPSSGEPDDDSPKRPTVEEAHEARRHLRLLLGHETQLPSRDSGDLGDLSIFADTDAVNRCRPYEIGGVDRDLVALFLESKPPGQSADELLDRWRLHPEAELQICPALDLVRIWGPRVPRTEIDRRRERLRDWDLRTAIEPEPDDAASWRVAGDRLRPETSGSEAEQEESRRDCWKRASRLGGGWVELVRISETGDRSSLVDTGLRHLDLESGIVAPAQLGPAHLRRTDPSGACPACRGEGRLPQFDLRWILGNPKVEPGNPELLGAEAQAIFKGVHRSILGPFLKRMTQEGLWPADTSFADLGDEDRRLFLFGFWHRPGPGSFLKNRKADPAKVASWLRWDGLFRHLEGELSRSRHSEWQERISASRRAVPCPFCRGSGLGPISRVVRGWGRSLQDWITEGTVGELFRALRDDRPTSPRARGFAGRLSSVLEHFEASAPLIEIVDAETAQKAFATAASSLLRLPVLDPNDEAEPG